MEPNRIARKSVSARINPISIAVASAVGSLATIPIPLLAADSTGFFDEMVVSATRRDTDIQDVPYNIAALSGETLEKQRLDGLSEFARWVPGLSVTDQGSRDSDLLTVRGLNTSTITAPEIFLGNSGGGTVATYVGDIPLYVDLKLYDIDRVEVLIGPQGTLYGAGTLGGAVRYIPKKPQLDSLTIDAHVKTYLMSESDDVGYGGDVVVNVPISDALAFRGLLGYVEEAGFIDYDFLVGTDNAGTVDPEDITSLRRKEDVNDAETLSLRGSILWNITDAVEAIASIHFQDTESGGRTINHAESFGTENYVSGHRFLEPNTRENRLFSFELNWDLGLAQLTSATGYSEYEDDGRRDQTDLLIDIGYGYEDFPQFSAFTRDVFEENTFSQEVRLVSSADSRVNWIVGGYYSDFDLDGLAEEFTPGYPQSQAYQDNVVAFGGNPLPLATGNLEFRQLTKQTIEEYAIFGEVGFEVTEQWQVTVGTRWFNFEEETRVSTFFPFFDSGQPPFPTDVAIDDDDIILKFNTSYTLENAIPGMTSGTAYFTVSEGYRNGASNGIVQCDPSVIGQTACASPDEQLIKADTTLNYELGIHSSWLDGGLVLNAGLFFIEWDDIRVRTITDIGLLPISTNGGSAESMGVELSSRWDVSDNWAIFGSYAYTEAELTEAAAELIGGRFGAVDGQDGDRLSGTPEHQGSLFVNYTMPIGSGLTLDVNYGLSAISDVLTKVGQRNGGEALGGFTVHNASASVSAERWEATLFVDNVTDKFARTGVRGDTDFIDTLATHTLRRYYHNVIQPRTIGLDFRYKFDIN